MKTEFIPKIVTLLAGAIVCIISLVKQMDTTYSLEILLAVLVIFYIIGCIARIIIDKVIGGNRFTKEKSDKKKDEKKKNMEDVSSSQASVDVISDEVKNES